MRSAASVLLPVAFALGGAHAAAQAPTAAGGANAAGPEGRFAGVLDVGYVNASGNNRFTSLVVTQRGAWTVGRWRATEELGTVYGETDRETSADQWRGLVRLDRAVSARVAAYALGTWLRDPFAGIADRWEQGVGVAAALWDTPWNRLRLDAGISRFQQLPLVGARLNFWAARTAAAYRHAFGAGRAFQQHVEFLPSLDARADWLFRSESALQAPLSRRVSLTVSYIVRYDNLPEPGKLAADRTFTSGVQLSF